MDWTEIVKIILYATGLTFLLVMIYRYWVQRKKLKEAQSYKFIEIGELPEMPFSKSIELTLHIPKEIECNFYIKDDEDQTIDVLFKGVLDAGIHSFVWDTTKIKNKFYYLTLKSKHQLTEKKVFVKND